MNLVVSWPCDEKRETRLSCGNWNNRWKMQQGKQRDMMMDELTKWLKVGRVTETLKATKNGEALKSTAPD